MSNLPASQYTKHIWSDYNSPDLEAKTLNEIEDGIAAAIDGVNALVNKYNSLISSSASQTVRGQYALDIVENNPNISGTLANKIGQLNSDMTTAKNDISAKPSMDYVDKINDQAVGTPLLNSGATILENIMSRYNAGLIKGGFPVAPQAGTTTGVADRPAGADSYGYVSWFKMSSDEIWVIYYAENTVKQYNRLIVTGKWQSGNDWVLA